MPAPIVHLEDLLALAATLRDAGFALGTKQYIAAHELLIALAARGRLPEDPQKWQTLLGPIFCSSRREQAEFATHFAAWLQRRPALQKAVEAAQPTTANGAKQESLVRHSIFKRLLAALQPDRLKAALRTGLQVFTRPAVWGSVAAVTVLLVVAAFYLNAKTERVLTGKVISDITKQPLAGATVTFLDTKQQTDAQGEFRFSYQIHNYERWQADKIEGVLVEHLEHDLATRTIATKSPARQEITLPKSAKPATFTPPPLPPATNPQATPSPTPQNTRRLWPAAVPLLLYALWLLWRWWWRRLILQRQKTSGTPRLQPLKLKRDGVKLFDAPGFRRAVVELRRHRHIEANDLDVAATVRATIRRGGLFTPSFGRRRTLPEYLLLIDRASLHDEQARVGDALAERLKAGEIGIEWFYFQGDARTCRSAGLFAPTVTLNELAARFPDHRLLVFGDGAGFFDPFSGEPQRWLGQFDHWTERAVITPVAPAGWGYHEEVLQDHDFMLLPASADGFEVLTAWLNAGLKAELRSKSARPFPEMVTERPKRWLERLVPQQKVVENLIEQLKGYLDEEGWLWLRACAVYPQVTWELTLYLGARLLGQSAKADWAERVLQLVRLPWFRYGTMPDWLRAELIVQFTLEQEAQVRGVIADLLQHVLTKPGEAIPIEIATPPEAELSGWRRLWARVGQWWRRRKLYRMLQAQEDSQLRDYVFLSFLVGQRPNRLAVQAPQWWRWILFTDEQWAMGLRPVTMGVLALLASVVLFGWFWIMPIIEDESLAVPAPEISPMPLPTVPPDVPITQPSIPLSSPLPTITPTPALELPMPVSEELTLLKLINDYRAANGVGTLQASSTLTNAAKWMSNDMATKGYFSHTDSNERDPFTRIRSFGYNYKTYMGENVAAGQSDAINAFNQWKNSPGHNQNMLHPDFKVIGIGRVVNPNSHYGVYWTTDFGGLVDEVIIPTPTPDGALAGAGTVQSGVPPLLTVKGEWAVTPVPGGFRVEMGKGVALDLRVLSGGNFVMGSGKGEDDEQPTHQVQVLPFWMGQFEVTQAQWQAVMGNNPSSFKGDNLPVGRVSWEDAKEFCRRLSQKTGVQFRLPTEAEWEYAARAGTKTEYSFGDNAKQLSTYAWYDESSGGKTHPVGMKVPNPYGLFDMYGNALEWCEDVWHGSYVGAPSNGSARTVGENQAGRVLRGGSQSAKGYDCRSANRIFNAPDTRFKDYGFRVVVGARTP